MKVLGVTCSTKTAFLSVVDGDMVVVAPVDRLDVASLHEASAELLATLDDVSRALAQIKPDLVVLLLPEQSRFKRPYAEVAARASLETLVRLACAKANVPVEVMPRPTVRARLELPKKGELASHVAEVVPAPVGKHWTAGRDVAALAALAGAAGS